jgi:DNA-binding response OmpR family regulator
MTMDAEKRRMLIVEDDSGITEMLRDRLESAYAVTTCDNQEACYRLLGMETFDVVLLDLKLPLRANDMTPDNEVGIDILKHIRSRRLHQRNSSMVLPVVVMTAHGTQQISAHVLVDLGANHYIAKPFGPDDELEQKIDRAIRGTCGLIPAANVSSGILRITIDDDRRVVLVDDFEASDDHALWAALIANHAESQGQLLSWNEHRFLKAKDLAKKLDIREPALRRRITRLRARITEHFQAHGRTIGLDDVIENSRWKGYRLNPRMVDVVRLQAAK